MTLAEQFCATLVDRATGRAPATIPRLILSLRAEFPYHFRSILDNGQMVTVQDQTGAWNKVQPSSDRLHEVVGIQLVFADGSHAESYFSQPNQIHASK